MKKLKYFYIYKTTNLVNGKYYIGMHSTYNLDDGYMGSGKNIRKVIKIEGKQNFKTEILEFYNSAEDCSLRENEIVNKILLKDNLCYNIVLGGNGFQTLGRVVVKDKNGNTSSVSINDPRYLNGVLISQHKGKSMSFEKRKFYSKIFTGEGNPFYGKTHTKELKEKWSLERKGKPAPNKGTTKVLQIKDGQIIKVWDNLVTLVNELKCAKSNIVNCIKGRRFSAIGYQWKYQA